ncbi:hypothetical protein [Sinomonas susongensis]|uniref:hypothetical protein n=1 Tax=Sinomonas susongensis TaxID=1324851 RepID=UPI001108F185|nr:hypothetical protein [Sinomonas susongensis]
MIDWGAFLIVAIATVVGAGCIVLFFALGVRLRAESADPRRSNRKGLAAASSACYALSGAAVLYGVFLIVPYFHH